MASLPRCLPGQVSDDDVVERYLAKLGLVELQILQLEKTLQKEQPQEQRVRYARRLADLYAGVLLSSSEDDAKYQDTLRRIDALVGSVPQANTASLEVMRLQADFHRAESLVSRWLADRKATDLRVAGHGVLQQITPLLDQRQQELNQSVEELSERVDNMQEGDQRDLLEQELRRVQELAGRATFLAAWSNYYLGLTQQEGGTTEFARARQIFRQLLGIEEDYSEVDPAWLGLESSGRSRALIGLGLTEAALQQLEASRACFAFLDSPAVAPQIKDQVPQWYVQGLLNAGRLEEARAYARQQIAAFSGNATAGKVGLCVLLAAAGFSQPEAPAELGLLGIAGLAKLGEFRAARQLVDKYNIPLQEAGGFYLGWVRGQQLLDAAGQSKRQEDYRAAAQVLATALAAPEAKEDVPSAGKCRSQLAWCYFQLGEYQQAARQFERALTGLKAAGDQEAAARAAWNTFIAYEKLSRNQASYVSAAVDALKLIQRDFPNHPYARRVDYYLGKLQGRSASPREAVRQLENVPPDNPNYLAARYDLCLLLHQQWSQAAEAPARQQLAEQLRRAVQVYLDAAKPDTDAARQLRCQLLAAETALSGTPPDATLAETYLSQATPLLDKLPPQSSLAADYHYRALQKARLVNDDTQRRQHAQWLVRNAAGSRYELTALVTTAKAVDAALEAATAQQRPELLQEGRQVYWRLVRLLDDSGEVSPSHTKNAQVARSKLADYLYQLQQYAEASGHLEQLLATFPKNKDYLRRAGLAHFQARQYEDSIGHWRTLLRGLSRDTDDWHEAKYYQLACLLRLDKEQARKVFRQFQLLNPDLGPAAWRGKFKELAAEISG